MISLVKLWEDSCKKYTANENSAGLEWLSSKDKNVKYYVS